MKSVFVYNEKGIVINKKIAKEIVKRIKDELELSVHSIEFNFVTSETIVGVNKKYLGHNYSTDIITFDYSNEKNNLDGEIFISLPDAVENSKKYGVPTDNELIRLITHGILHLVGYNDTTAAKKKKMKIIENELVEKFQKYSKGLLRKV